MNHIGPSLLPVAPAPAASETIETELPADGDHFDTLLRQCRGENAKPVKPRETASPKDSHAKATAGETVPDAEMQAGIAAMLVPPQILPLMETAEEILPPDVGELAVTLPEGDGLQPSVILPDGRQTPLLKPSPQDNFIPPATPARDANTASLESIPPQPRVANVRGIMPPVLTALVANDGAPVPVQVPSAKPIADATPFSQKGERLPASLPSPAPEPIVENAAAPAGYGENRAAIFSSETAPVLPTQPTLAVPQPREAAPTPERAPAVAANTVISIAENVSGMTAAKPGGAMSAPTLQQSPRTAPANPAASMSGETAAPPMRVEGISSVAATPLAAVENERDPSAGDFSENADRSQTPTAEFSTTTFPIEASRPAGRSDAATSIPPTDIAQVVTHTQMATERLRVSGQERLEIAVKLDSGHELTIQLRIANGQVTPIIRTESEPLRLALEQNWSLFSQRSGDREVRITTPIFESPQSSSNMSDPNQQRDGRQRAFNEPAPDFSAFQNARRNAAPNAPRATTLTNTPGTGVRLYA